MGRGNNDDIDDAPFIPLQVVAGMTGKRPESR